MPWQFRLCPLALLWPCVVCGSSEVRQPGPHWRPGLEVGSLCSICFLLCFPDGAAPTWCSCPGCCVVLIPRCPPADSAERVVQRFEVPGVSNYTALLLSPDGGTLYLGAREVLFAVNTSHFQHSVLAHRVSPRACCQHHESTEGAGDTEPSTGVGSWCVLHPVRAAQRELHHLCRHRVLRPSAGICLELGQVEPLMLGP